MAGQVTGQPERETCGILVEWLHAELQPAAAGY
jgi:hypothetical protein